MKPRRPKRTDEILADMITGRIKEIRNSHNHTQEQIYEATGLDLAHIEVGRVVPSVISLSIFCGFYGLTLDEFFAPMSYPPKKQ